VLHENSIPIDFIGFLGSLAPCFRYEDPARGAGHTVSQSARLHMVQPVVSDPDSCAQTTARRVKAQVEETDDKKPGPDVLVLDLESLEKMEIRSDYSKTRNGHPLEEKKVSRILAEKVAGEARETGDCE
jgi:RNase adaptor protein for sRNA GlmZ degradation